MYEGAGRDAKPKRRGVACWNYVAVAAGLEFDWAVQVMLLAMGYRIKVAQTKTGVVPTKSLWRR